MFYKCSYTLLWLAALVVDLEQSLQGVAIAIQSPRFSLQVTRQVTRVASADLHTLHEVLALVNL